jgi:predicted amidohydrolase YtcJ
MRELEPMFGADRFRRRMPVASFARAGAAIAAGSDWPVSSMNPFDAMEAAVTRGSRLDPGVAPDNRGERIDLATILFAYTLGGAYAMAEEKETGSLEVGKAADFAILDRDLFAIPITEVHDVRVLSTWLLGKKVYP